jgi:molybdenum cofactor cytidylyltransferase
VNDSRIAIIVLAAGASRRLGRPKQLLELGGEPLIRHIVRHAMAAQVSDVVVVLGNEAETIRDAIGELGQRVVVNQDFAAGQSTSMVTGLTVLGSDIDAAILMLGDQPTVSPELLKAMIERFQQTDALIVQPRYDDGKPGNPVLLSRRIFPELLAVTGDIGAREVVRAHRSDVESLDVSIPHPLDVDSEEDYEALKAEWEWHFPAK